MAFTARNALAHVVLVSFRAEATRDERDWALATCQGLGAACGGREAGILVWRAGSNLDPRKNWHLVEWAVFRDAEALQNFRAHPAHVAAARELARFADWVVGDIDLGDAFSPPGH